MNACKWNDKESVFIRFAHSNNFHIITFNLIELGRVGKGTTVIEIRPEAQINAVLQIRLQLLAYHNGLANKNSWIAFFNDQWLFNDLGWKQWVLFPLDLNVEGLGATKLTVSLGASH